MLSEKTIKLALILLAILGFSNLTNNVWAADKARVKTITVTVKQKQQTNLPELGRDDFIVMEDGSKQEVISVVPATSTQAPLNLALVIEDGLQVNNEIPALKSFMRELPAGSQVMIAYLNGNFVEERQSFTTDLALAASRLRIVNSFSRSFTSPYLQLIEIMKQFNGFNQGRNEILFISKGTFGSAVSDIHLSRAIKVAQQENITIFSLYAPPASGRRFFTGQNGLYDLSEETGGEAFFMGTGFVTFDAPLTKFNQLLNQQYLISYKSTNESDDLHRVKVSTDYSNIKVRVLKNYRSKS
ncbi:MAG: VWA domain-containing protein [Acidobacteriota bacterium]